MPKGRKALAGERRWYLADLVMQITVAGEPRSVVHVNTTLVRADSADAAYNAAVKLGREGQQSYDNEQGDQVRIRFRGLRDLYEVFDRELDHGTELIYSEDVGLPEAAVKKMVTRKDRLVVFSHVPGRVPGTPDYMPGWIARMLRDAGADPKAERPPDPTARRGAAVGGKRPRRTE